VTGPLRCEVQRQQAQCSKISQVLAIQTMHILHHLRAGPASLLKVAAIQLSYWFSSSLSKTAP
jgi:hypothetical protein